jgi:hypothetical protein
MLKSAKNFALGFFGWPSNDQYREVVMIEADGFNNTLAPYKKWVLCHHLFFLARPSLPLVSILHSFFSIFMSSWAQGSFTLYSPFSRSCPNASNLTKSDTGTPYLKRWTQAYLPRSVKRINAMIKGYKFSIEDAYTMQQVSVAILFFV